MIFLQQAPVLQYVLMQLHGAILWTKQSSPPCDTPVSEDGGCYYAI